tara:strand:- start:5266 stop:6444 length:1179 start_codon:yes stop_codon:yes gene_type:complete
MVKGSANHFSKIEPEKAERFSSGIDELDWMFGSNSGESNYGIPEGTLSLWGGAPGVGKTRTTMHICKNVLADGKKVLFFTLESQEGQFKERYCKDWPEEFDFHLSETKDLEAQVAVIRALKPDLVVVDSINKIKDCYYGRGANKIEDVYRLVASQVHAHIMFITHLNAEGKIKGGTHLPHMVDTELKLTKFDGEVDTSLFVVTIDDKNRFGKTGVESIWAHLDDGVECQSNNRQMDVKWVMADLDRDGVVIGEAGTHEVKNTIKDIPVADPNDGSLDLGTADDSLEMPPVDDSLELEHHAQQNPFYQVDGKLAPGEKIPPLNQWEQRFVNMGGILLPYKPLAKRRVPATNPPKYMAYDRFSREEYKRVHKVYHKQQRRDFNKGKGFLGRLGW